MNKRIDHKRVCRLLSNGIPIGEIARILDCSERQLKRIKKQHNIKVDHRWKKVNHYIKEENLIEESIQAFNLVGNSFRITGDILGISHQQAFIKRN